MHKNYLLYKNGEFNIQTSNIDDYIIVKCSKNPEKSLFSWWYCPEKLLLTVLQKYRKFVLRTHCPDKLLVTVKYKNTDKSFFRKKNIFWARSYHLPQ